MLLFSQHGNYSVNKAKRDISVTLILLLKEDYIEYKNKQNKMILFGIVIVFILALAPVFWMAVLFIDYQVS